MEERFRNIKAARTTVDSRLLDVNSSVGHAKVLEYGEECMLHDCSASPMGGSDGSALVVRISAPNCLKTRSVSQVSQVS